MRFARFSGLGRMVGMSKAKKENMITPVQKKLNDAIALAADIHREQVRDKPDGRPYICHVLDVVHAIPEKCPEARLVAALHDTIEDAALKKDTPAAAKKKRDKVRRRIAAGDFGPGILEAVEAISHIKKHGVANLGKAEEYLLYVQESVLPNPLATKVKIIDNYVNMKDLISARFLNEKNRERLHKYASSIALLTAPKAKKKR